MSSIIFQDIREFKSLAYSVHASYSLPENIYDSHYFLCYLSTRTVNYLRLYHLFIN